MIYYLNKFFSNKNTSHKNLHGICCVCVCRNANDGIVEKLEVVTLSPTVPVQRFAQHHHLPVHTWPPLNVDGQFDVGVVVSFGCLLPERLIKKFPL